VGSGRGEPLSSTQQPLARVERERLIESNLPLVTAVARRYEGRGAELEDLVQVGAIGLIKAIDRFDPARGSSFASFATPTIEGEIRHHLRDRTSPLRIPRELQHLSRQVRRRRGELEATLGRAATVSELAVAVAADERDVERALVAEQARASVPIPAHDAGAEPAGAAEPFAASDDRLLLAARMRALDERQRRIVYLRYHADMTERQIARELGISQAHVSRLLAAALEKLREEPAATGDGATPSDTTVKPVISPASGASRGPDGAPGSVRVRADTLGTTTADNRIDDVSGPRAGSTVARYLELPYHVTVTAERAGDRSSWRATVEELPECSAQGETPDEAVEHLRAAMEAWLTTAIAEEKEIPAPNRESVKPKQAPSYSGRFLVRMDGSLHEQLAQAAERQHVSLNRLVTEVLAASVSPVPSATKSGDGTPAAARAPSPGPTRPPARTLRVALAANLVVVVLVGLIAVALLVLALERGI
jgi:RNA polymerase sigma-B factor